MVQNAPFKRMQFIKSGRILTAMKDRTAHLFQLISMVELALTASIFDFVVSYGKFYTLPDEKILIEKNRSFLFYFTVILAFLSQIAVLSSHLHVVVITSERRKLILEWLVSIPYVHGRSERGSICDVHSTIAVTNHFRRLSA